MKSPFHVEISFHCSCIKSLRTGTRKTETESFVIIGKL